MCCVALIGEALVAPQTGCSALEQGGDSQRVEQAGSNHWLFPIMVAAAAGVVAFGCVGILAITAELSRNNTASDASRADRPLLADTGATDANVGSPSKVKSHGRSSQPGLKPPTSE